MPVLPDSQCSFAVIILCLINAIAAQSSLTTTFSNTSLITSSRTSSSFDYIWNSSVTSSTRFLSTPSSTSTSFTTLSLPPTSSVPISSSASSSAFLSSTSASSSSVQFGGSTASTGSEDILQTKTLTVPRDSPRPSSGPISSIANNTVGVTKTTTAVGGCASPSVLFPGGVCRLPIFNEEACVRNGGTGYGCPAFAPPTAAINLTGTALASYHSSVSYGRSPQCKTDYSAAIAAGSLRSSTWKTSTFTTTGTAYGLVAGLLTTFTNTITNARDPAPTPSCCGRCRIFFPSVEVFYFRPPGFSANCGASVTPTASSPTKPSGSIKRRAFSLAHNASEVTAVGEDGFIYTSPSVYVDFQNVYATDGCGIVGSYHTSVTLAFTAGELLTLVAGASSRHPVMVGLSTTSALKVMDLECVSTRRADARPVLALPQKLLNLDPAWRDCSADVLQGLDPPKILVPGTAMDPATTIQDPVVPPTPASPESSAPVVPVATDPAPVAQTTTSPPSLGNIANPPKNPVDPANNSEPNALPTVVGRPGQFDLPGTQKPPPVEPPKDPVTAANHPTKGISVPVVSDPPKGDPQAPQSQVGQVSNKGIPESQGTQGPNNAGRPSPSNSPAPAIVVQGQTIAENAAPVTIGGNTVAYAGGSLYVGSNVTPIQTAAQPQPQPPQQQETDPITVAGVTFGYVTSNPEPGSTAAAAVLVEGQILSQNAPAITVGGTPVAYWGGSILVGSSAAPAPSPAQQGQTPGPAIVGGLTFSQAQPIPQPGVTVPPAVVVQGQTITEGSVSVMIGGTAVAYSAGSVYVGTIAAPAPTPSPQQQQQQQQQEQQQQQQNPGPAVIGGLTYSVVPSPQAGVSENQAPTNPIAVVGGQTVTAGSSGIEVGGTPLAPGAPAITIAGTPVSLGRSGLVVGSSTIPVNAAPITATAIATVAGQTASAGPPGLVILGSTTLTAGGAAITVSGTPVSLGSAGLVVGTSTIPFAAGALPQSSVFTVAGQTFTANPTAFVVAGTTLSAGGPGVTISGTPVSLGPSGSLVIGTSTIPFAAGALPQSSVFTVAGQTFTANPTALVVAGTTLSAGGPGVTISGTPVSLGPSGSLLIGTSTVPLGTSTVPLGEIILSGFGPIGPTSTTATSPSSPSAASSSSSLVTASGSETSTSASASTPGKGGKAASAGAHAFHIGCFSSTAMSALFWVAAFWGLSL